MSDLGDRVRTRILPAILTAAGVTLLTAGLLTYTVPVAAEPAELASPSPGPTPAPTATPLITLPPLASAPPTTPSPTPDPDRVATRIRIAALGIDLPVVPGNRGYPLCDVAMYLKEFGQPGQGRATYIYAHARTGMFLPLLETRARDQLGAVVEVWTSDDLRFLYEIVEVRRDQRDPDAFVDVFAATTEQLWLQTSEGPKGTPGKTQVIAEPLSIEPADPADAHPTPDPVVCG